jgi:hypothetical protein
MKLTPNLDLVPGVREWNYTFVVYTGTTLFTGLLHIKSGKCIVFISVGFICEFFSSLIFTLKVPDWWYLHVDQFSHLPLAVAVFHVIRLS